jgi:hypothetical protein
MDETNELEQCMVKWEGNTNTTTHRFNGTNATENRRRYARYDGGSIHRALRATGWKLVNSELHKQGKIDYYERAVGTGGAPGGLLGLLLTLSDMIWLVLLLLIILVVVIFGIVSGQ